MTPNLSQAVEKLKVICSCYGDGVTGPEKCDESFLCELHSHIDEALRQTREEALEEAAKVAESGFPMNTQQISVIVERIHALKSNSDVNEVNTSGSEEGK